VEEYVFPMINKMTPIPVNVKNSFGTAKANMKNAIVRVVEGESSVPGECTPLGICDIELPPFLPKGSPVELTYRYDANQVLEPALEAVVAKVGCFDERNDVGSHGRAPRACGASLARRSPRVHGRGSLVQPDVAGRRYFDAFFAGAPFLANPRLRISASVPGSLPRNARYPSAGSTVSPAEKTFLRSFSATAWS